MGYNAYSFLGAYIEMPQVEINTKKKIRRCSNVNCPNHINTNLTSHYRFCTQCGKEVETIEVEVTQQTIVDYYNFATEHGFDPEKFCQVQERKILISNRNFGNTVSWNDNEELVKEFEWGESRKNIVEFTKEAQSFIDKYKEVYGMQLEVKYGIVSYIS